jgi:hypothetical protein
MKKCRLRAASSRCNLSSKGVLRGCPQKNDLKHQLACAPVLAEGDNLGDSPSRIASRNALHSYA